MARLGRSYSQPRPRLVQPVPSPPQTVDVASIPTEEAFGTASVNLRIDAVGIGSAEAFGAPSVEQQITPAGIATAEAFGTVEVDLQAAWLIMPASLPSVEAFGTPEVRNYGLAPASVTSAEAFGAAAVTVGPVDVDPSGIPSAEVFGTLTIYQVVEPLDIPSVEAFGTPTIHRAIAPAGIISAEAFGTAVIAEVIAIVGIVTGEAFGTTSINPQVNPFGIPSAEVFGATLVVAKVITPRFTAVRAKPTYELVCVARVPQSSGPPVLLEVDPIDWTGLTWVDELSKPQQLQAGCKISNLTEAVLQRLRKPAELGTELWLYRNGRLMFAGPMLGWQVQGEGLSLSAGGLLSYLKLMTVDDDLVFNGVDQFTIATTLINQWQSLDYGNFGIDTSGILASGVTRDATYLAKELHNVGQRVAELGLRDNGFDISVDPSSRKLKLSYPLQGVDRSVGEDAIIFDDRNVTSPNIVCSVAPGDVASDAYGTGTSSTASGSIISKAANLAIRASYGRSSVTGTFDSVSEQSTLDGHVQGLLDARDEALLIPGPDTRVTPDADLASYDVGDTVAYELHSQLGITGGFRLRKRQVTVSGTGQEAVSVQFV